MWRFLFLFMIAVSSLFATANITHIKIQSSISPASSAYLQDALKHAKSKNSKILLIELDTPGGLAVSMREMIKTILNSKIPVVVYVSPKGAHAASAGTYILYSAHFAAMAPGTNIGAATPVAMMQPPKTKDLNISTSTTLEKKVLNDAMAYIKSLAELRDRNVSWALQAVKEGKSLSAKEALRAGVIDTIAEDTADLIGQLNDKTVKVADKKVVLDTKDFIVSYFEQNWKVKFLMAVTDPNITYILLLIAIYGIFFELMNPGSVFPGVVGLISGVMVLYALNLLPFNYAGLLLMFLGIAFMVAEVFIVGFGILGIAGLIAFVLGSLLLFDAQTIGSDISISLIIALSLVSLAFFVLVIRFIVSSKSTKAMTGVQEMIGSKAFVIKKMEKGYLVHCHGEVWDAISDESLEDGQEVQVESISGLVLSITSKE